MRYYEIGSSFGVMQGRLSEQTDRGYQAFPWDTWTLEFDLASVRNLEHIEWVLDSWQIYDNPLLVAPDAIGQISLATGVNVVSVCADYLMDQPLSASDIDSWRVLEKVVSAMHSLGARSLVVPCVDKSSLRDPYSLDRFSRAAVPLAKILEGTGIQVALETDLGPSEFEALLGKLDPEMFGVNYDTGNSASLNYSSDEEFDAYGDRVSLVHLKDRIVHGNSVLLGEGDAEIPKVIERLLSMDFNGPVTLQAFRDAQGLKALDEQLSWLRSILIGEE